MIITYKYISLVVVLVFSVACGEVRKDVQLAKYIQNKDIQKIDKATEEIILLGDTQAHVDSSTATFEESKLSDKIVDVASRPVQANIGVHELLKQIVAQNQNTPIVHLGDFLDVSCYDEFRSFSSIMSKHKNWVAMMGNHDGFYLGNYMSQEDMDRWSGRCDAGRLYTSLNTNLIKKIYGVNSTIELEKDFEQHKKLHPSKKQAKVQYIRVYNKATVIERYLNLLLKGSKIHSKMFDDKHHFLNTSKENHISDCNDVNISSIKPPYNVFEVDKNDENNSQFCRFINYTDNREKHILDKIYSRIDQCQVKSELGNCNPQRSFLLQQISLPTTGDTPKVKMILLDTSTYTKKQIFKYKNVFYAAMNSHHVAAKIGRIGLEQLMVVKEWVKENNENNIITVFAGHHPLDEVDDLKQYFKKLQQVFYVSAHTHQGYWKKDKSIMELNVGSLIDFPIHYRTLKIKSFENTLHINSELKEFNTSNISKLTGIECKQSWTNYEENSFLKPKWQESLWEGGYFKSKHFTLASYLEYYLKLLEDEDMEFYSKNISINWNDKDYNRSGLVKYLKKSIKNFEIYLKEEDNNTFENDDDIINSKISDNNSSCIYKPKDGKLTTQNCSRILFALKLNKDIHPMIDTKSDLATYHICSGLNAAKIDANNTTVDYIPFKNIFDYAELEKANRSIENVILEEIIK